STVSLIFPTLEIPGQNISTPPAMADKNLVAAATQLRTAFVSRDFKKATSLVSNLKLLLLERDALLPNPTTPKNTLQIAREVLEIAALVSIHLEDAVSFTRYFNQLQPF